VPKRKVRRFSPLVKTRQFTKGQTAQKVELYNSAYKLAWEQISSAQRRQPSDISLRIHASIRRQLEVGATDPFIMASTALEDIDEKRDSDTH